MGEKSTQEEEKEKGKGKGKRPDMEKAGHLQHADLDVDGSDGLDDYDNYDDDDGFVHASVRPPEVSELRVSCGGVAAVPGIRFSLRASTASTLSGFVPGTWHSRSELRHL